MSTWTVTRRQLLSMTEIKTVINHLKDKARRSINARVNLTVFRLATCCGLRVSELTGLTLDNIKLNSIHVPKEIAKNGKARRVPLTWDQATRDDIHAWKAFRESQGATGSDPFLCLQGKANMGKRIDRWNARDRFKSCCACLGEERQREVTIHHGRHSFVSHALHNDKRIVDVQHAVGHSSLAVTSIYAHVVADDDEQIGNLFG
jgi:integrase/recombinase XerD